MVCSEGLLPSPSFFLFAGWSCGLLQRKRDEKEYCKSMADQEIREYELVYILQPELAEDAVLSINDRVAQIVADHQGEMVQTELWGRRTLAYPIQKHFEGHYVLRRLTMFPDGTDEVERYLRFNEDVMRFLIMRSDS
jgi:small subunit ribosomal protein S6